MKTLKEQFKHVEKLIFYPLAIVLLLGVILGFAIPEAFSAGASALLSTILNSFSAFFIVISGVALLFAFAFCCTPFSKRVIGGPDQKPMVKTFSYICIITTGSIGSTILFWGVAEPLMHFTSPPTALGLEAGTAAAASAALAYPTINWACV